MSDLWRGAKIWVKMTTVSVNNTTYLQSNPHCIHTYTYIRTHTRIRTHTHEYTHAHTRAHTYTDVRTHRSKTRVYSTFKVSWVWGRGWEHKRDGPRPYLETGDHLTPWLLNRTSYSRIRSISTTKVRLNLILFFLTVTPIKFGLNNKDYDGS